MCYKNHICCIPIVLVVPMQIMLCLCVAVVAVHLKKPLKISVLLGQRFSVFRPK